MLGIGSKLNSAYLLKKKKKKDKTLSAHQAHHKNLPPESRRANRSNFNLQYSSGFRNL